MKNILQEYYGEVEVILEELLLEYGISLFIGAQIVSGAGLLLVVPDGIVTPTFVLTFAESLPEVLGIATVSAASLVTGNFLLYSFFRLLGERVVSEERRKTKTWRFMAWAVKRNAKVSLVLLRLTPVGSGLVAIPAGLVKVKAKTFLIYSFIGFLIFEVALATGVWYGTEHEIFNQLIQKYAPEVLL